MPVCSAILGTTTNFFSIHHNTKSTMSPKIISIEANIGAGKSTLLNRLEKRGYTVVYEPIDEWTHGDNLLQHMYQDPKRYMLTFQTYALTTRVKALREALSRHNHKDEERYMEGSTPQKIWGLRRGCEADLETVKNDRNVVFYRG